VKHDTEVKCNEVYDKRANPRARYFTFEPKCSPPRLGQPYHPAPRPKGSGTDMRRKQRKEIEAAARKFRCTVYGPGGVLFGAVGTDSRITTYGTRSAGDRKPGTGRRVTDWPEFPGDLPGKKTTGLKLSGREEGDDKEEFQRRSRGVGNRACHVYFRQKLTELVQVPVEEILRQGFGTGWPFLRRNPSQHSFPSQTVRPLEDPVRGVLGTRPTERKPVLARPRVKTITPSVPK
jgi:hypothetical protein